jgi:hypothetical protein
MASERMEALPTGATEWASVILRSVRAMMRSMIRDRIAEQCFVSLRQLASCGPPGQPLGKVANDLLCYINSTS